MIGKRPRTSMVSSGGPTQQDRETPGKRSLTQQLRRRDSGSSRPTSGEPPPGELPSGLAGDLGTMFGADLSGVRLREDGEATALGADAFARGDDVVFAPGRYDPGSREGMQLLGHELAHVVQQRDGRVAGAQGHGAAHGTVDDPALEAEADAWGDRVAALVGAQPGAIAASGPPASSAAPVQRRVTAHAVPATFVSDADVQAMTITRFLAYTRGQADWSTHYTAANQAALQQLLHDLLAEPALPAGLGGFTVTDVLARPAADWAPLRRYCAAVNDAAAVPTAKMAAAPTLARAIEIGNALPRLEVAVGGGGVLYHITAPDSVGRLLDERRVDELILYCTARNPQWQAPDGKELESFFHMPPGFHLVVAGLADVRNLHHFQFAALTRLLADRLGGHTGRPLSLILHAGVDHSGAFHHDPQLTNAIENNPNRVVLIEGKETLAEIEGELPTLAATYGGGRIDQVMIAGHGNSRVIELAGRTSLGTTSDGRPEVQQTDDTLDLDNNSAATLHFFDTLTGLMGGPDNRIVFNGCLTASNDLTLTPGGGTPPSQLASQLDPSNPANRMSLVETMRRRLAAGGSTTQVIGANASFPEGPELMNAAGQFDILSSDDPALTAQDRLEYVRHGIEPTGVLRAVLERWEPPAAPPPAWLVAVNDRLTRPETTWPGAIITTALTHIQSNPADAQAISDLAHAADIVSEAFWFSNAHVAELSRVHANHQVRLFSAVEGSTDWPGEDAKPPIAIYLVWARRDAGKYGVLVSHLTTNTFTTSRVREHLDWTFLGANLAQLLPATARTAPSRGNLVVACANVTSSAPAVHAREFLKAIARANSGSFPAALGIPAIADDSSEEEVLSAIGMGAGGGGGGGGGGAEVRDANVDANNDGTNERYVDRVAQFGEVVSCEILRVHAGPGNATAEIGFLRAGDRVFVQGTRDGWCSIDFNGRTGYVWNRFLNRS